MREILFRGKRTDNNEWIEGFYTKYCSYKCYESVIETEFNEFVVKEESIGQYTGLKDKNGTMIFEGDICTDGKCTVKIVCKKYGWYCEVIKGCVLSVGLEFPIWQWDNCEENRNRQLEVIGNIYDNPEF